MSDVYLNGEYLPLEKARIPVLDRGFTFGDGIYEVFLVYNRKIFRFDEHIERLNNSLAAIYIDNPHSSEEWLKILNTLISGVPESDQSIYLQVTRGVSERDHDISLATEPTVFAMCKALPDRRLSSGIKAIICEDIRWSYCHIKAITLLPGVMLRHKAKLAGAREAILVKGDIVTEGAASNVFIVRDGIITTTPKDGSILPGITRDLLVELLIKNNFDCREDYIKRDEIISADEIWITSSTWEIVPVIMLDEKQVGNGKPGPVWQRAIGIYQEYKNNPV